MSHGYVSHNQRVHPIWSPLNHHKITIKSAIYPYVSPFVPFQLPKKDPICTTPGSDPAADSAPAPAPQAWAEKGPPWSSSAWSLPGLSWGVPKSWRYPKIHGKWAKWEKNQWGSHKTRKPPVEWEFQDPKMEVPGTIFWAIWAIFRYLK